MIMRGPKKHAGKKDKGNRMNLPKANDTGIGGGGRDGKIKNSSRNWRKGVKGGGGQGVLGFGKFKPCTGDNLKLSKENQGDLTGMSREARADNPLSRMDEECRGTRKAESGARKKSCN